MQYTQQGPFVPDGPPGYSAARMNAIEAGVMDANADQEYGTLAARPPATVLRQNHIYWAYDTGERFLCDGTQWLALPVGSAGLQSAVSSVLPSSAEKTAFGGLGGMHNFSPQGYTQVPDTNNHFLLQSAIRSFFVDTAGGGTADVFETGLWLITSVYGFNDDSNITRTSIAQMSFSTGGEGLKGVIILATAGYARNVTTSHTAVNHDTSSGAVRITTSHGNTRTFFRSVRANASGGSGPKGS